MTEQMSNSLWSNKNDGQKEPLRLSLNDFIALAHGHLFKIKQAWPCLQRVYNTFEEQNEIMLGECDYLLKTLNTLYRPLQSFVELCADIEHLPLIVLPLRYQLASELSQGKEQVRRLAQLTNTAISAYRVASGRAVRQLCAFTRCLEEVLQISENIPIYSQILFDQARFLERREKSNNPQDE